MKEPNIEKLWEIVDSFYNGKRHQVRDQIRAYGVKRFFRDAYGCVGLYGPEITATTYAAIAIWFFYD